MTAYPAWGVPDAGILVRTYRDAPRRRSGRIGLRDRARGLRCAPDVA